MLHWIFLRLVNLVIKLTYCQAKSKSIQVNSNWIGRRWYYFRNFPTPPPPGKVPIADSKQHPGEYNIRPASDYIWNAPWPQFWPKFRPEKNLPRKFFDPKNLTRNFWPENFCPEKFCVPKIFLTRKILCRPGRSQGNGIFFYPKEL